MPSIGPLIDFSPYPDGVRRSRSSRTSLGMVHEPGIARAAGDLQDLLRHLGGGPCVLVVREIQGTAAAVRS